MLKVLIVEDDLMIADMAEEALIEDGYEVCGIARSVAEAVLLGKRHRPDLAVIDLRLANGGLGTSIAPQLAPFIGRFGILYVTGKMSPLILNAGSGDACIDKPYRSDDLLCALEIVTGIVVNGAVAQPFPRGFQLLQRDIFHG
jgi:DNA-binding response OmpR family regulator